MLTFPEEINQDQTILPNVTLILRWNDTRGESVIATRAITEMICDGVASIFGPEGSCHTEAIVAQSRNIPMIAYVSATASCELELPTGQRSTRCRFDSGF
jgi:guanylate cyclase, other